MGPHKICATWLIHTCVMSHSYVCHDSFIAHAGRSNMCAMTHPSAHTRTSQQYVRDMTHSYVCHVSFTCVPRLTRMLTLADPKNICVTWLIHTCVMSHSHVCHDSFIAHAGWSNMCAMTHPNAHTRTSKWHICDITHDLLIAHTSHIQHVCQDSPECSHSQILRIYVWHDSLIRVSCLIHMCATIHSSLPMRI